MAMVVGEVLTFKHFQNKDGQMILNVWNYQIANLADADINGYTEAARGLYYLLVPELQPLQVPALTHTRMLCEELEGLEYGDFVPDTPLAGLQNTEAAPIFVSASIQYVRGSKITRHGWKRIGGIAEFFINVNTLSGAGITILQDAITAAINPAGFVLTQLDESNDPAGEIGLFPVIVGDPIPPSEAYRVQRPTSVVVKPNVTTQNTRKIGRGS